MPLCNTVVYNSEPLTKIHCKIKMLFSKIPLTIKYIKNKSIDFDKDKITKSTYKETETAVGDQDKDIENLEGGKKRKMSRKRKRSKKRKMSKKRKRSRRR